MRAPPLPRRPHPPDNTPPVLLCPLIVLVGATVPRPSPPAVGGGGGAPPRAALVPGAVLEVEHPGLGQLEGHPLCREGAVHLVRVRVRVRVRFRVRPMSRTACASCAAYQGQRKSPVRGPYWPTNFKGVSHFQRVLLPSRIAPLSAHFRKSPGGSRQQVDPWVLPPPFKCGSSNSPGGGNPRLKAAGGWPEHPRQRHPGAPRAELPRVAGHAEEAQAGFEPCLLPRFTQLRRQ